MSTTEARAEPTRLQLTPRLVLAVAAAGAAGALLRLLVGELIPELHMKFPWTTFAINVAGSALLGLLVGIVHARTRFSWTIPVLGTGLLGSFTTFSAVMLAAVPALSGADHLSAGVDSPPGGFEMVSYLVISAVLCTAAAAAGITLGRAVFGCAAMDCPEPGGAQ
ncbi:fluoride efflux transporter FluC [Nesterenkonia alba]|uniref:fluoride efflux transporter FluC n=1 Tax=Nesterenkonia alba TaxID=515814 RepID=UPI000A032D0E|nr:CrcB family protein [Nesterenkonia alba]